MNLSLQLAMHEADKLSRKMKMTPEDRARHSTLMAHVANLRAKENRSGRFAGIVQGKALFTQPDRESYVKAFRALASGEEIRAVQTAGQGVINYPNSTGASFVPLDFMYSGLQSALKTYSPLFDADKVTFIQTETGNGIQLPLDDDTSENATVVGEANSDTTYDNIGGATQVMNNVYMYRTPKIKTTMEFAEDTMANLAVDRLETFFSRRIARGVGADLLAGTGGGNKPLGLIPSLQANGVNHITAAGSASDDGGSGNGANSIGSQDLRNLFYSIDRAYRDSPKAAWIMADSTLNAIDSLRDKQGQLQHLIKFEDGQPMLLGKPIYTDATISPIAVSQPTVIFGDLSRWLTRYVPSASYVTRYNELPGFAEAGLIGWDCAARFGGSLLSASVNQTPINFIQQHS